eukprot:Pgem_evm1s15423
MPLSEDHISIIFLNFNHIRDDDFDYLTHEQACTLYEAVRIELLPGTTLRQFNSHLVYHSSKATNPTTVSFEMIIDIIKDLYENVNFEGVMDCSN